jgi:hypothetical protein
MNQSKHKLKNKNQLHRSLRSRPRDQPVLRFTPTAWSKLISFCHHGDTEIGGFGVSHANDLLLVEDFVTVKQHVSIASVVFDDAAVADYFEDQVDAGRKPEQFSRIWLHTHPGDCPLPSTVDEATFARVFGACDWAIMFILARGGATYCRLRFNAGPGGAIEIPTEVDFTQPFAASDHAAWVNEYARNIHPEKDIRPEKDIARKCLRFGAGNDDPFMDLSPNDDPRDLLFEPSLGVDLLDVDLLDIDLPDVDLLDGDLNECEVHGW